MSPMFDNFWGRFENCHFFVITVLDKLGHFLFLPSSGPTGRNEIAKYFGPYHPTTIQLRRDIDRSRSDGKEFLISYTSQKTRFGPNNNTSRWRY